ncbi:MAG: alcohol dehydrogenase catalytic domain-containing protein [Clostridia bacterium]|nr:alcohol dehydrogenase catalytic domain-containing protein [Clostridia bacterium]
MKALVKETRGKVDFVLKEIPTPKCPDNGVLLKVRTCAICGSDIHYYTDAEPMPVPQIMGHEFCGDIAEVGKDVTGWQEGDFVLSRVPVVPCGECEDCKAGHPEACKHVKAAGLTGQGAYAQYIVSYPDLLYPVPANVSENMAACVEPSAIAYHAVKRFNPQPGMKVAVVGVGIIGLLIIRFLKIKGIDDIIAVGMDSDEGARLPLAKKYGANTIINGQHRSSAEQILELTDGKGVDMAIDAAGLVPAIDECYKMLAKGGILGAAGVPGTLDRVSVNWNKFVWGEQSVVSTFSSEKEDWDEVIKHMESGELQFDDAISHELKLEEWEDVFKNTRNPSYVKAVFHPNR